MLLTQSSRKKRIAGLGLLVAVSAATGWFIGRLPEHVHSESFKEENNTGRISMAAPWQSSNSANKLHSAPGQYVLAPASMQEAIQRLVKEDIDRMHAEIPELTHTQLTSIESELMSLRKRDPIVVGQEELALKRLLTPSQFSKWQESLIKQRRLESEDFAHTKLRDVRRVLPNLSEEQSDMVFQKFGQEFLNPLRSDKEILAEILSPQQYELWISKQTFR